MNKFYVYVHRKATDNSVFYVGKGCDKRANDLSESARGYNPHYTRTAKKHGVIVEIIKEYMSSKEAYMLEKEIIEQYKIEGVRLTNLTPGGEGFDEDTARKGGEASFRKHRLNHTGWFSCESKIKATEKRAVKRAEDENYLNKLRDHGREQASLINSNPSLSAKRSERASQFLKNLRKDPIVSSEIGRLGGKASTVNRLRFTCSECGMISNPGAIGRHQKYSGHTGVCK